MKDSLISVILPVKNGERFLAESIKSVLSQDYRPIELLVVDGHSTDRTPEIAQSFQGVNYIIQVGDGVADAWNFGLEKSKGEFIAFMSSDDLWTSNKLSLQANWLNENPEIKFVIPQVRFFLTPGSALPPGFREDILAEVHLGIKLEALLARRSLFAEVGTFRTDMKLAQDVEWWARVKDQNVPSAVIREVLLYKRVHEQNLSYSSSPSASNQSLLFALRQSVKRKKNQSSGTEKKDSNE